MKVLSAEAMARVDRRAMEEIGIPGMVLMENAAIGLADTVGQRWPDVDSVAIFCGPGNNGGDGLALGRHLASRGYGVRLWLVYSPSESQSPSESDGEDWKASGDAGRQQEICQRMGLSVLHVTTQDAAARALEEARNSGLVVDALFGTGLSRPLKGHFAYLAEELGRLGPPVLAVDLPSGLGGPELEGPHARADVTVTFAAPKIAHIFAPDPQAVGELVIADLGIPVSLLDEAEGDLYLLLPSELEAYLLPTSTDSYKGDFGHAVVVAGAPGTSGAATLAVRAAVRSGAGLVTAAVPESIWTIVEAGSLESMTTPLRQPKKAEDRVDDGVLLPDHVEPLVELCDCKQAVAIGPGLGRAAGTEEAVRAAALRLDLPLVLDADGLNAFEGQISLLQQRRAPTVLTPHAGELARLISTDAETKRAADVLEDRLSAVRQAAAESGCVVILKGHRTLVATAQGEVYVNLTGNSGMATGGTGDVLTGLLVGLLAQGYEVLAAAQLAVCLHGTAGDLAAGEVGETCMTAADLIRFLPAAFRSLHSEASIVTLP